MKKSFLHASAFLLLILFAACSETMDLPDAGSNQNTGINRDPNKYVRISPDWSFDALDLQTPLDIFPAANGRLYIADSAASRIRVIRPSGEIESGLYDTLASLPLDPAALCMDARLNLYYCDQGGKIYVWPEFSANTGIRGIVTAREYKIAGKDTLLHPLTGLALGLTAKTNGDIIDTTQTALMDSLTRPSVFYDPASVMNRNGLYNTETGVLIHAGNPVYAQMRKSFVALAPAPAAELSIYALDAINNYILKITMIPALLVRLSNGQNVWHYTGMLESFVATAGTGAGTVSDPLSMCTDNGGNIYYTQTGDFFSVHKLSTGTYRADFSVAADDIMRLDEFAYARDISVAPDGYIFVLDTLDRDVKMYKSDGTFMKSVAVREEWLRLSDSLYVNDSLVVRDTLVLQQYPDLLKKPMALCYYQDVLYILDNGNRRILRFTKVDDVIIENPDREE